MARKGPKPYEPGGEAINVTVTVNGIQKYSRTATITTEIGSTGNYRYTTDDGKVVNHNRHQGVNEMAKKLL